MTNDQIIAYIAELETENWLLRRELFKEYPEVSSALKLPRREAQVLGTILRYSPNWVSKERIASRIYDIRSQSGNPELVVESHVSKLRSRLRPLGIAIDCARYTGYAMSVADAAKVRSMIRGGSSQCGH